MPKDLDGELSLKAEPVFKVEDSVDIESLINVQKSDNNADSDTQWRSYPCRDCDDMLFTSDGLLRWHRVQMHRPHKCQKCGTVLIGRRNFSQHVRKVHPGLPISKVFVVCTEDEKKYLYVYAIFHRRSCITDCIPFVCLSVYSMITHNSTIKGSRKFKIDRMVINEADLRSSCQTWKAT